MATLNATVMSLLDWAKRTNNGKTMGIVELLSQQNAMLRDIMWQPTNDSTTHKVSIRTGLPAVYWRMINQAVATGKSTTAQVVEGTGMLEAWSEADVDLVELAEDKAVYRLSESKAFLEAMTQELASTFMYGNAGLSPEEFTGLSPRYSAISGVANASNVLTGSGSGSDNASIWLVGWGENATFGLFPKNSQAGIKHEDLGIVTVQDATGIGTGRMRAYQDHWQWKAGLVVKDWRYVVRIPNIDISNLVAKSSAADLVELMIKAIHRIPILDACRPVFYMNRTCFQMLDIQRRDDVISGGGLIYKDVDGYSTPTFRNIPVRICDALLETEAAVA